jgi:hypothetical protein
MLFNYHLNYHDCFYSSRGFFMPPPPLVDFWKPDPHPGDTPQLGVDGTQTTYALCFARSINSF